MNIMHVSADLVALDALLQAGSVSAAARQVGVTQSAMSHTLARLRANLDDPLLVRAGRRLVPTVRAEAMAARLREAVAAMEAAVAAPAAFDPRTAKRVFRIGMPDYGELVLLPELTARLGEVAPGVDLVVVRASMDELIHGAVDALVQPVRTDDAVAGVRARALFRDSFVCVVREGHPFAHGPVDAATFACASHLLIAPRGRPGGVVDDTLAGLSLRRRTAVQGTSFLAAPYVIARTDLVLTLAARVARIVATGLPLCVLPHPLRLPGFTSSLLWHDRHHDDPGHAWLRELIAGVSASLPAEAGAPAVGPAQRSEDG